MTKDTDFLMTLQQFYESGARDLPWRIPTADGSFDPYAILVSEIMLQQTQVGRVVPKYQRFLKRFPSVEILASASLSDVLSEWVGLGYNRRARYLYEAAKQLGSKEQPWQLEDLVACKGIGPNTAAAVLAYTYDLPVIFVETNIRTVLIHHFFTGREAVSDKEMLEKLATIVPWVNPPPSSGSRLTDSRLFYWAMMDYGTYLKATVGNLNKHSKSYARQSKFEGSRRQLRGRIIRELLAGPKTVHELATVLRDERLEDVVGALIREKLVKFHDVTLMLYNEN